MRESASDFHPDSEISVNRENQPTPSRSYAAMVLSALLPGLGQIYLQKTVKGFFTACCVCFGNWYFLYQFASCDGVA